MKRDIFIPPPVLPAQAPINIINMIRLLENSGHIFMLLSGVNFTLYFFLLMRRTKEAFQMEEVRWYFIIYTVTVLLSSCTKFWN